MAEQVIDASLAIKWVVKGKLKPLPSKRGEGLSLVCFLWGVSTELSGDFLSAGKKPDKQTVGLKIGISWLEANL